MAVIANEGRVILMIDIIISCGDDQEGLEIGAPPPL